MAGKFNSLDFQQDFEFLSEMKQILLEFILRIHENREDPTFSDSELKNSIETETHDGRNVRLCLPSGFDIVWNLFKGQGHSENGAKEIKFVGFIGHRAKQGEEICDEFLIFFLDHCK